MAAVVGAAEAIMVVAGITGAAAVTTVVAAATGAATVRTPASFLHIVTVFPLDKTIFKFCSSNEKVIA